MAGARLPGLNVPRTHHTIYSTYTNLPKTRLFGGEVTTGFLVVEVFKTSDTTMPEIPSNRNGDGGTTSRSATSIYDGPRTCTKRREQLPAELSFTLYTFAPLHLTLQEHDNGTTV